MKTKIKGTLLFILVIFSNRMYSQQNLNMEEGIAIINHFSNVYPKFNREFNILRNTEKKIKGFNFIRSNGRGNPASVKMNGFITIDISFIENSVPNYDDNRLVVVLFHEIGHLHYFTENKYRRNKEDNEKFAFEYSLKRTKELAENGDCMPLKTGLKYMKLRSQSNNLDDEHVRALKRMVNEPLYYEYMEFAEKCASLE